MAWAVGDGFPAIFKNFTRFANQHDWGAAVACCRIKEVGNPGVVPRNRRNELCFENAAAVLERSSAARGVLYWPERASEVLDRAQVAASRPEGITASDRARHAAMLAEYSRALMDADVGERHDTEPSPPLSESEEGNA